MARIYFQGRFITAVAVAWVPHSYCKTSAVVYEGFISIFNVKNIAKNNGNKQTGKKSNKTREMCGTGNNRAQSLSDNWHPALYIKARGWPPYSYNIHNSRQVKCLHVYDILCHNDYFSRWTYSYIGFYMHDEPWLISDWLRHVEQVPVKHG